MMNVYKERLHLRWADIDANRHLRHSVYYDFAASARVNWLTAQGLTSHKLEELHIGPILFREEAVFRREIKPEDQVDLTIELTKATSDFSRWGLRHYFVKSDGTVATVLNVDGAWMHLQRRKLVVPDLFVQNVFSQFPRSADFEWVQPKAK
jgi:acyl-CoA thioester hydrolase